MYHAVSCQQLQQGQHKVNFRKSTVFKKQCLKKRCEMKRCEMKQGTLSLGRRGLLLAGGVGLAGAGFPPCVNGQPANERIQIGVIGLGSRGYNLIDSLVRHHDQARIVAICDVDKTHYRDRAWGTGSAFGLIPAGQKIAAAYAKHGVQGSEDDISQYSDYRDLLERSDIDAVVIATPDHWHAKCTLDAVSRGKDVYCEKPVTHLFSEGLAVCREVERRQAVFQTGSQQRSDRFSVALWNSSGMGCWANSTQSKWDNNRAMRNRWGIPRCRRFPSSSIMISGVGLLKFYLICVPDIIAGGVGTAPTVVVS